MRKALALVMLGCLLVAGYALSPLWIAMEVRRAIHTGDTAVLEARVDWPAVRRSLKDSLAEIEQARKDEVSALGMPRPTLWQRIKIAATPARYADQLIERYVTPDGVIRLAAARGTYQALLGRTASTRPDDLDLPDHALPVVDRAQRFWSRLRRVDVLSATRLELEMADRRVPERSYVGTLAFEDWRWRLVAVQVRGVGL